MNEAGGGVARRSGEPGRFVAALACEGGVRVMAVVVTGPAEELRWRHELTGPAAVLGAEGLVASVLLAAHVKGEERLTVDIRSEKPSFSFTADVNGDGTVRARFRPTVLRPTPKFSGMIAVLKSLGTRELYRGVAEVRDEGFAGALQRYLTASQQVDARVRVEAELAPDGTVEFAAGLLVERLPDFPAEEFAALFGGPEPVDLREVMTGFAFGQLGGSPVEVLGSSDILFRCTCTRERVLNMLRSLGPAEVASLIAEQGRAEVTCHYCAERYEVGAEELGGLFPSM